MEPASNTEFDQTLTHCHGDALAAFDFQYKFDDGTFPANPLERVVMQFRSSQLDETKASVLKTISTDSASEIVITDAATWSGTVQRQSDGLPIGTWYWGMYFEDDQGLGDTLGKGKITITPRPVIPV